MGKLTIINLKMKYAILSALLGLTTAAEEIVIPKDEELPNFLSEIAPAEASMIAPAATRFMESQHELMAKGTLAAQLLGQRLFDDDHALNQLKCQYFAEGLRGYTFTPLEKENDFYSVPGYEEENEAIVFNFCNPIPAANLTEKYSYCEAAEADRFGYAIDTVEKTCVAITNDKEGEKIKYEEIKVNEA